MRKRCPKCQGVSASDAAACRWCRAPLADVEASDPAEADGDEIRRRTTAALTNERVERERLMREEAAAGLAELRAWMKTPADEQVPGVLRLLPWLILVGAVAVVLWRRSRGDPVGMALGAIVIAVGAGLALQDFLTGRLRFRRTPEEAVRWFADMLKAGRVDQAMLAVATSTRAAKRRAQMPIVWGKGPLVVLTYSFVGCTELAPGLVMATLLVSLHDRPGGERDWTDVERFADESGTEGFGSLESPAFKMERLLLRRGGRWYLANGLPDSALDRVFAEIIQA